MSPLLAILALAFITPKDNIPAATKLSKIIELQPKAYMIDIPRGRTMTPTRIGFIDMKGRLIGWIPGSDIVPKNWILQGLKFSPNGKSIFVTIAESDYNGLAEIVTSSGVTWKKRLGEDHQPGYFWVGNESVYGPLENRKVGLIYGKEDRSVPLTKLNRLLPSTVRVRKIDGANCFYTLSNSKLIAGETLKNSDDLDLRLPDTISCLTQSQICWQIKARGNAPVTLDLSPDSKFVSSLIGSKLTVFSARSGKEVFSKRSEAGEVSWLKDETLLFVTGAPQFNVFNLFNMEVQKGKKTRISLANFFCGPVIKPNMVLITAWANGKRPLDDGVRKIFCWDASTNRLSLIATCDSSLVLVGDCFDWPV